MRIKIRERARFFYGALYVNYALSSGMFIVLYLSDAIWIHMETWLLLTLVTSAIIGLYPFTYRWGRIFLVKFFCTVQQKIQEEKKLKAIAFFYKNSKYLNKKQW